MEISSRMFYKNILDEMTAYVMIKFSHKNNFYQIFLTTFNDYL
jgi:hypothetical protein